MEEEQLTGIESLRIIETMIRQAKNQFSEDGHLYLLWGWLILACSIGQFLLLHIFHSPWHWTVWLLTWVLVVYQFVYLRRKFAKRQVRTYAGGILGVVWLTFVIVLVLLTVVLGNIYEAQGKDFYAFMNPIFLVLYGIPTFISGHVLKFRPLWIGAIACWILAIVSALLPYDYEILMLAPAMVVAWIVPGYLLRARFNKVDHGL